MAGLRPSEFLARLLGKGGWRPTGRTGMGAGSGWVQVRDECRSGMGAGLGLNLRCHKCHLQDSAGPERSVGMVLCLPCPTSDAISRMQAPVGTAQAGCATQLPPCPSRDGSGFVLAVHRPESSPSSSPGLGCIQVKKLWPSFSYK